MHRILTLAAAAACGAALCAPARAEHPSRGHNAGEKPRAAVRDDPGTEEERRIPAMYEEAFPERARRMREMGREHPEWFRRALRKAHHLSRELEELKETNLEEFDKRIKLFRKESAVDDVAAKLRATRDEREREGHRKRLRAELEELFDMKEAAQRDRVARMEQEIKTLKERLDRRRSSRAGIIDRHLRELEGGDELEF